MPQWFKLCSHERISFELIEKFHLLSSHNFVKIRGREDFYHWLVFSRIYCNSGRQQLIMNNSCICRMLATLKWYSIPLEIVIAYSERYPTSFVEMALCILMCVNWWCPIFFSICTWEITQMYKGMIYENLVITKLPEVEWAESRLTVTIQSCSTFEANNCQTISFITCAREYNYIDYWQ